MRRISLCLLIAFASTAVGAREVKLCSEDGGSAPSMSRTAATKKPVIERDTPPVRETRSRASLHSDVGAGRPGRWHSFLPGMFR